MNSISLPLTHPISDLRGEQFVPQAAAPVQATPAPVQAAPPTSQQQEPIKISDGNLQGSFEYNQDLNQVVVTLRREDTGEVVQQFPNEHIIRMLMSMMQELGKSLDLKA